MPENATWRGPGVNWRGVAWITLIVPTGEDENTEYNGFQQLDEGWDSLTPAELALTLEGLTPALQASALGEYAANQ